MNQLLCVCTVCKRSYKYDRQKGHRKNVCGSCHANKHKNKKKLQAVEFLGGKCQYCGYNKCVDALHFHHIDRSKKDFKISGNHSRKWERIKQELEKCILLCANCHAEIHSKDHSLIGKTPDL